MSEVRKEKEREELHRAIWAITDELRGSVDGWDFKSYVLGMMFYRYISENLVNYINEGENEAGNKGFDYVLLSDEEAAFIHIEESAKGSESENNFACLFDDIDVNSNKLGVTAVKRNANLVKLMEGIAAMRLGNYKENSIDAFDDAYEYLMSMYASNAGKGGEFFTPQEVSELLTRIAVARKTEVNKIYESKVQTIIQFSDSLVA